MNKRIKFPLLVPCSVTFSSVSVEHKSHSEMYSYIYNNITIHIIIIHWNIYLASIANQR